MFIIPQIAASCQVQGDKSMNVNMIENDTYITQFSLAFREAEVGLKHVPPLLKRILREKRWQSRVIQQTGETVEFENFADFVMTQPLEGLGLNPGRIALLRRLCQDDPETLVLLDEALTAGQHLGSTEDAQDDNLLPKPEAELGGTAAAQTDPLPKTNGRGAWVEEKMINGCGPYRYLRWRENGRLRSKYLGKAARAKFVATGDVGAFREALAMADDRRVLLEQAGGEP